jgi:hypothetical protein
MQRPSELTSEMHDPARAKLDLKVSESSGRSIARTNTSLIEGTSKLSVVYEYLADVWTREQLLHCIKRAVFAMLVFKRHHNAV